MLMADTQDLGARKAAKQGPQGRFLSRHPAGLAPLFFTELWERFSYYGMRALLTLFMVAPATAGGLGLTTADAAMIYGNYTMAVYMLSIPGGFVADNLIGPRRAVLIGGTIIALGHFMLAVPSLGDVLRGPCLHCRRDRALQAQHQRARGRALCPGGRPARRGFLALLYGHQYRRLLCAARDRLPRPKRAHEIVARGIGDRSQHELALGLRRRRRRHVPGAPPFRAAGAGPPGRSAAHRRASGPKPLASRSRPCSAAPAC